jgi:hypothetical protein
MTTHTRALGHAIVQMAAASEASSAPEVRGAEVVARLLAPKVDAAEALALLVDCPDAVLVAIGRSGAISLADACGIVGKRGKKPVAALLGRCSAVMSNRDLLAAVERNPELDPFVAWIVVGVAVAASRHHGVIRDASLALLLHSLRLCSPLQAWQCLNAIDSSEFSRTGEVSSFVLVNEVASAEVAGRIRSFCAEHAASAKLLPQLTAAAAKAMERGDLDPSLGPLPSTSEPGGEEPLELWRCRPCLLLSDIDDTLLPTLHDRSFPAQSKFFAGKPYPGCSALLRALRRGPEFGVSTGRVVCISARPSILRATTVKALNASGLGPITVVSGSLLSSLTHSSMAAEKARNAAAALDLYAAARVVLLGDSGQADVAWHQSMLRSSHRVHAALVHDVVVSSNQRPQTRREERTRILLEGGPYLFDSYVEASLVCWQCGAVSFSGLAWVVKAASTALLSLSQALRLSPVLGHGQACTKLAVLLESISEGRAAESPTVAASATAAAVDDDVAVGIVEEAAAAAMFATEALSPRISDEDSVSPSVSRVLSAISDSISPPSDRPSTSTPPPDVLGATPRGKAFVCIPEGKFSANHLRLRRFVRSLDPESPARTLLTAVAETVGASSDLPTHGWHLGLHRLSDEFVAKVLIAGFGTMSDLPVAPLCSSPVFRGETKGFTAACTELGVPKWIAKRFVELQLALGKVLIALHVITCVE